MIGSNEKFEVYGEYKDSGIEFLGEIPKHWKVTKLKYVTKKIGDGLHGTPEYDDNSNIAFINGNNLQNGNIKITEKTRNVTLNNFHKYKIPLKEGTILISINGTIGNLAFYHNEKILLGKSAAYIELKEMSLKDYVFFILQSTYISKYFISTFMGTTINNLSLYAIRNTPIIFPSLLQQNKIVHFLDHKTQQIDNFIELKEKTIALLEERKAAIINQAVTKGLDTGVEMKDSGIEWLGEIPKHWSVSKAKFVSKVFVPERAKPELDKNKSGIPWVTTDLLRKGKINLDDIKFFVSDKAVKETGSRFISKGSVLATCVGTFGLASEIEFDCIINQQIQGYTNLKINPTFLVYLIQLSEIYFKNNATQTTIMYVNKDIFGCLPICLPPMIEQEQIISTLSKKINLVNKNILNTKKEITLIKEYRQSLISAAVTGKIKI